ncbi:protein trapped in endoderm-1 isoform X2 [Eurytemora carolleeae]|uniref:protein trapped in endoderm-1 isoform X2 n=1 Tax=Eurytemora carolleeae TaxID=1294199 RepID=UPI000C7690AA|nr:protein trapped in endoderm-1 isoform X2 [Eurytemora carolleeae]|eukprot:XP_023326208.1 protein trapped in endoderm-1-like isoform X2 [Eurytemora affinis]
MAIMHDLEEEESDAENISSVDTFVKNMSLTYIFNSSACTLQDDGSVPWFIDQKDIINNCIPMFMQNTWLEPIFLTNIFCIIAIGGMGNLLLILSVIYVFFRYPATRCKYPWLKNPLTILILHLSFCDFLYCIFGLPFLTLPTIYGYFPLSESVCHNTALFRNLNAFAEFSTIAVIGLLRLKGLVTEQLTSSPRRDSLMTPCKMVLFCCLTWLLSFINISPTLFEVNDPNLDFGKFGYNDVGICNVAPGTSTKRSMAGFAFSVGFLVPCLLINISYITLFCLLKHRSSQTTNILDRQRRVMDKVSKMLLIICISYLLFCGQLAPIGNS